ALPLACRDQTAARASAQRGEEIARCSRGTGEEQQRLALLGHELDEHRPLRTRRLLDACAQRLQPRHLLAYLPPIGRDPGRRPELPEQHLLNRHAVLLVRKRAAVIPLRERATAGEAIERALVKAQLPADRLEERGLARFESPPQETAQQRSAADERKLQ